MMESFNYLARITPPFHPGNIQAVTLGMVSDCQREWQRILYDDRISADIGFAPHLAKLVNPRVRPNVCTVFNSYMSGQCRGIRHYHVVPDDTVMRKVRLRHNQTIITQRGQHTAAFGAAVYRDKLSNSISFTDPGFRWLAFIFQVLRCKTDRHERKDNGVFANKRASLNHHMGLQAHSVIKHSVFAHN